MQCFHALCFDEPEINSNTQTILLMHSVFGCRGHTVRAVTESFHMSKDAGFKVQYFQSARDHDFESRLPSFTGYKLTKLTVKSSDRGQKHNK